MTETAIQPSLFPEVDIKAAVSEIFNNPYFVGGMRKYLPARLCDQLMATYPSVETIHDFQATLVLPFLKWIERTSIDKLTVSGLDHLEPDQQYLFISNHKDIVLDSAFLNMVLFEKERNTSQIAIGDNLMVHRLSELIFRINKSFVVKRSGTRTELYEHSVKLANYIYQTVAEGTDSVWLAQREGRSKDGNDRTQVGVLKMLSLANQGDLLDFFSNLHIVPVSITYELDPTDWLKAQSYVHKQGNPDYKKEFQEDVQHILLGLTGQKGRVHFHFGQAISKLALEPLQALNAKQQLEGIAQIIDTSIHANYQLQAIHAVAHDLLSGSSQYGARYSSDERTQLEAQFITKTLRFVDNEQEDGRRYLLSMYANLLENQEIALKK